MPLRMLDSLKGIWTQGWSWKDFQTPLTASNSSSADPAPHCTDGEAGPQVLGVGSGESKTGHWWQRVSRFISQGSLLTLLCGGGGSVAGLWKGVFSTLFDPLHPILPGEAGVLLVPR